MKATEVTAGLAESNGSLLPGLWRDSLHVICGLTACTPGSAPGPTLGNEYGKTVPLTLTLPSSSSSSSSSQTFLNSKKYCEDHFIHRTGTQNDYSTKINYFIINTLLGRSISKYFWLSLTIYTHNGHSQGKCRSPNCQLQLLQKTIFGGSLGANGAAFLQGKCPWFVQSTELRFASQAAWNRVIMKRFLAANILVSIEGTTSNALQIFTSYTK